MLFFAYGPSMKQAEMPAEICYLAKPGRAHFNSWDFAEVSEWGPKPEFYRHTAHWRNPHVFAVEFMRRFGGRVLPAWVEPAQLVGPTTFEEKFGRPWKAGKEWRKPSFEEHVRYALAA